MRILFLVSTFAPTIGGAETYALNLTRGLTSLGHTVSVVTDHVTGEPSTSQIGGVPIHRLYEYRERFQARDRIMWEEMAFGLRPELSAIVERFAPDAIMSNSLDLCVLAKLCSIATNSPWIAAFHEQAPERDPFGDATLRLCYGLLEPDKIVAGSRFYLKRALQFGQDSRCHLIHHGIDTAQFRPLASAHEVREAFGLVPKSIVLASVGRFKARKGFLDLIEAFALLPEQEAPVCLIIVGSLNSASAEYYEQMRVKIDRLGLGDRVRLEDTLTHDRIPWLVSGSDIVVQASLEEGLGLAVIEAMACERPVIATRICGHTEIVNSNDIAILVDAAAPQQLAHAITSLLNDDKWRARLGRQARQHVVSAFSLHAMASSTASLIRSAIEGRGGHGQA